MIEAILVYWQICKEPRFQDILPPDYLTLDFSNPLLFRTGEHSFDFQARLHLWQGWRPEFPTGGLTLPTRGLKYGFNGTKNATNLRKNRCSPSDEG